MGVFMKKYNMKLGITEYIDSAHFLPGHDICGITHGHTYKIEVVIEGTKNKNGMVMDFYNIKMIVKEVLKEYDHRLLNDIIENPSVENMCEQIHKKLSKQLKFPLTLKIWEGNGKWCEISDIE